MLYLINAEVTIVNNEAISTRRVPAFILDSNIQLMDKPEDVERWARAVVKTASTGQVLDVSVQVRDYPAMPLSMSGLEELVFAQLPVSAEPRPFFEIAGAIAAPEADLARALRRLHAKGLIDIQYGAGWHRVFRDVE